MILEHCDIEIDPSKQKEFEEAILRGVEKDSIAEIAASPRGEFRKVCIVEISFSDLFLSLRRARMENFTALVSFCEAIL